MKTIKLESWKERPDNYTGIIELSNVGRFWQLNGDWHREDGPAVEYSDGAKYWFLNDKHYREDKYRTEMAIRNCTLGKLILSNKTKLED